MSDIKALLKEGTLTSSELTDGIYYNFRPTVTDIKDIEASNVYYNDLVGKLRYEGISSNFYRTEAYYKFSIKPECTEKVLDIVKEWLAQGQAEGDCHESVCTDRGDLLFPVKLLNRELSVIQSGHLTFSVPKDHPWVSILKQ